MKNDFEENDHLWGWSVINARDGQRQVLVVDNENVSNVGQVKGQVKW